MAMSEAVRSADGLLNDRIRGSAGELPIFAARLSNWIFLVLDRPHSRLGFANVT